AGVRDLGERRRLLVREPPAGVPLPLVPERAADPGRAGRRPQRPDRAVAAAGRRRLPGPGRDRCLRRRAADPERALRARAPDRRRTGVPSPGVMTGTHEVEIRWADLDGFGHASHRAYLDFLEEGRNALLDALIGPDGRATFALRRLTI